MLIEYKRDSPVADWCYANLVLTPGLARFYNFQVRIDGIEYDTKSEEFEEAFSKARMWEKLSV